MSRPTLGCLLHRLHNGLAELWNAGARAGAVGRPASSRAALVSIAPRSCPSSPSARR